MVLSEEAEELCRDILTFEEEEFRTCEDRLNLLNHLKSRYGDSIPEVLAYRREREEELSALRSFEEDRERLLLEEEAAKAELLRTAEGLSQARRKAAEAFSREVARELADLNFARADFPSPLSGRSTAARTALTGCISAFPRIPASPPGIWTAWYRAASSPALCWP